MDPVTLAATTVAFLSPYLLKMGDKAVEKVGEQLPAAAAKLFQSIRNKFKGNPAAEMAIQDLVDQPEDSDNQAALRKELRKVLEHDAAFLTELEGLLHAAGGTQVGDTITNTGSGAVATRGGVAAGEGGLAVQGDLHGNINLGGPTPRE